MERTERMALLERVRSGALSPEEAEALLAPTPRWTTTGPGGRRPRR